MAGPPAKTLLIVEPQPEVRRMLEAMLSPAGYLLIVLSDAQDAWELLRAADRSIDLLLSAATVRPMTGVELAEWATQWRPEIKILIMTAGGQAMPSRPGWAYLAKPFSTRKLLDQIQELLG
jgi:DNA-binding NtrC family response regulator